MSTCLPGIDEFEEPLDHGGDEVVGNEDPRSLVGQVPQYELFGRRAGTPPGSEAGRPVPRSRMPTSDRHQHRLAQGAAAVLSEAQAVALLPMNDGEARRWLRRSGLVRKLEGRRVVVWGSVPEAIKSGDDGPTASARPRVKPTEPSPILRRAKLEPIR